MLKILSPCLSELSTLEFFKIFNFCNMSAQFLFLLGLIEMENLVDNRGMQIIYAHWPIKLWVMLTTNNC